jgi:ferritin-like metal-binding protein YciE
MAQSPRPEPEPVVTAHRARHEVAGYGTVRTYAQLLGDQKACRLLQQTLDEEGETDKKLTSIAERVNEQAAA